MKRRRAEDDAVILMEKRPRKGPGYYTNLADTAPIEQEVAGESLVHDLSHSCSLGPHQVDPVPDAGPPLAFAGDLA